MSLRTIFVGAAIALQILIAVAVPVRAALIARQGTTVLLHVEPVDPYDPLRGYSLALAYDVGKLDGLSGAPDAGSVFVTLAPPAHPGGAWTAAAASATYPAARPAGTVVIRGRINPIVHGAVRYGIESLYLDEAGRSAAADRLKSHEALADVRVAPDGQAVLAGIR
jgi:uncharacterized membrane-anchored protein